MSLRLGHTILRFPESANNAVDAATADAKRANGDTRTLLANIDTTEIREVEENSARLIFSEFSNKE